MHPEKMSGPLEGSTMVEDAIVTARGPICVKVEGSNHPEGSNLT
jgi:hypothetical protein